MWPNKENSGPVITIIIYRTSQAEEGPDWASGSEENCWRPLQLHSISERLRSACPPLNTEDKRLDFTNVVDACCNLDSLKVVGSDETIGTSQLVQNELKFDFLAFKSLTELHLMRLNISPDIVTSVGLLRNTLQTLSATECHLKSISEVLLCDLEHTEEDLTLDFVKGGSHCWSQLLKLNLRNVSSHGRIFTFSLNTFNYFRFPFIFRLPRDSDLVTMRSRP